MSEKEITEENIVSKIFDEMKRRMPEDPYLKSIMDKMVADGCSEEIVLDIMLYTWLEGVGKRSE